MAGYPKIWTTILHEDWFTSLTLAERGAFLLLLLYCKEGSDDGNINVANMSSLSTKWACDVRTASKIVAKLQQICIALFTKNEFGGITISIPNYPYWQGLKRYSDHVNDVHKCSKNVGQIELDEIDELERSKKPAASKVRMGFLEWKPTSEAQKIFNAMKALYSPDTIKTEIVKMTAQFALVERTALGWQLSIRRWFRRKPEFDVVNYRPPMTAAEEEAHYAGHRRSDSDGPIKSIGDILSEIKETE